MPKSPLGNSTTTLFFTINPSPPSLPLYYEDNPSPDACIDGILIEINDDIAFDLGMMKAQLEDYPRLGMVIFGFNSYKLLEAGIILCPVLRDPLLSGSTYILAYRGIGPHASRSEVLLLWTAIDPITLEATGMWHFTCKPSDLRYIDVGQRW